MKLSENVKKLRNNRSWSQQELAKRTGLSFNIITKIEQGLVLDSRISTLIKLANAFNVSIEKLIN